MPIKTGQQYIDSLRDGRRLFIDGKVVSDVIGYPPLQGVVGTIASLYDDQHDPADRDLLTWRSPLTGEPVSATSRRGRPRSSSCWPAAFTCGRCAPSA